jgi:glycosyltransferase involved in cell wall biosynthesis
MIAKDEIKPLVIAFACEPAFGSEPGVGWHFVQSLARIRPVWVITHTQHRHGIESHLAKQNDGCINVTYYALPKIFNWAIYWSPLLNLYYYFWHIGAAKLARKMHREHNFSIAHHATYVRYWMPTAAAGVGIPYVWGPAGGGESAPRSFNRGLGLRGRIIEFAREVVRWIFERDPIVKSAARRCSLGIAASEESAQRMRRLGFPNVKVMSAVGHVESDADLRDHTIQRNDNVLRFISIGRLLHWKGFHLGLRAYAKANVPNSEYVIVGDGPDRPRLERLARKLGIADRVRFTRSMPRQWALAQMQMSDVLVFPSLHDSGGFVVLEAMDLNMPVICIDLGGPAVHVDQTNGFKIPTISLEQAIDDIADAMTRLTDAKLRGELGENGRRRALEEFSWLAKAKQIDAEYAKILARPEMRTNARPISPREANVALVQN